MTESYGLKGSDWRSVKKALYLLGGKHHRVTRGHHSALVKMPSGRTIAVGKAGSGKGAGTGNDILGVALKQLLGEVRGAKIDPILFLAVLENEKGAIWYKKDANVTQLARFLSENNHQLKTSEQHKQVMREFRIWFVHKRKEEEQKALGAEPATEETKVGKGDQEVKWNYTLGDVLRLTDIEAQLGEKRLKNIQSTITGEFKTIHDGQHGEVADKLKELLGGNLKITKPGKRLMYRLTEEGAWKLAKWLQEKYLPHMALKEIHLVGGAEGKSDKEDIVPKRTVADVSKHPVDSDRADGLGARISDDSGVRADSGDSLRSIPGGYGQKAVKVCEAFGVEVPWQEGGFAIDVEELLRRLIDRLLGG